MTDEQFELLMEWQNLVQFEGLDFDSMTLTELFNCYLPFHSVIFNKYPNMPELDEQGAHMLAFTAIVKLARRIDPAHDFTHALKAVQQREGIEKEAGVSFVAENKSLTMWKYVAAIADKLYVLDMFGQNTESLDNDEVSDAINMLIFVILANYEIIYPDASFTDLFKQYLREDSNENTTH